MWPPFGRTVLKMRDLVSCQSCYLVEWYREGQRSDAIDEAFAGLTRGAQLISDGGESATVILTVSVPTDDVIFCVFSASSSGVVAAACERAGIPAERVTCAMVPTGPSQIGGSSSQSSIMKPSPRATTVAPP